MRSKVIGDQMWQCIQTRYSILDTNPGGANWIARFAALLESPGQVQLLQLERLHKQRVMVCGAIE